MVKSSAPTRLYGWKRDLPDFRDHVMSLKAPAKLPASVDLRKSGFLPPVYDQGQLGSCTANAIAAALDFDRARQKEKQITPSRLFIYYNERAAEGTVASDAGAVIRDGIKVVKSQGACPESAWPYKIGRFAVKPSKGCYQQAAGFEALSYQRILQTLVDMKTCLAAGFPFVFGISVYDSFESDQVAASGIVPLPGKGESMLGGHAILCGGYDDAGKVFLFRNSWGAGWGMAGYATIPYEYLVNPDLASDFWALNAVK